MELLARGYTYEQIADELEFGSRSGAYKAANRGLKTAEIDTEELRLLQLERCEQIITGLLPLAMGDPPQLSAVDRIVSLMGHQARITGMYVNRTEIALTDTSTLSAGARERLDATIDIAAALNRLASHQPVIETHTVDTVTVGIESGLEGCNGSST